MPVPCWAAQPGCLTSRVSLRAGKVKQEPTLYREGPPYQRRGSLQLWQFLVTLLDDPANAHFIAWTGRGMEFKLIEPEEVWGVLCRSQGCSTGAAAGGAWGCGVGAGSFPCSSTHILLPGQLLRVRGKSQPPACTKHP